ncbi:hypothetical protein CPLU01_06799 [Colletotrichum plurivorum]|uniref:Zn(2)-C6 fungal-type domain-containing protein n=1 Tax=Colletotrichum plurivorum TaxID=2175906 RepID=A0A8H6NG63_9PEZI|nr:hypothetical protein CPLU01_06799 [Colletotrichum plurivorum]
MTIHVTTLTEADIPGAFSPERNYQSLALRMRWGIRNAIFHVAKEDASDEVLGVAMWLPPRAADAPSTWGDWLEGWRLWFGQVNYNLWYGRGGLNVKGKGIGAEMMRAVTETADREGMRCYLESSREVPNVAIYGRWGFRMRTKMVLDDDGERIELFTMTKCDEQKPACARCEDRGLQCPGYALNVRWSRKHQVRTQPAAREGRKSASRDGISCASPRATEAASDAFAKPSTGPGQHESPQLDSWLAFSPPWDLTFSPDLSSSLTSAADTIMALHQQPESSAVPSWGVPFLGSTWTIDDLASSSPSSHEEYAIGQLLETTNTFCDSRPNDPADKSTLPYVRSQAQADFWFQHPVQNGLELVKEVPREPFNLPTALSEYFFREVITLYCAWDSKSNVMRTIVETSWQSSAALYHTIQGMAAACLSEDFPHLLPVARREHAQALDLVRKSPPAPARRDNALLLASQLLGHTSSWLRPQDLATDVFRTSCDILRDVTEDEDADPGVAEFLRGTMDYWAMLLAFLTDSQHLGDWHSQQSSASPLVIGPAREEQQPHPYSGISRATVRLLAETGILIFQYRKRMSSVRFLASEDVDVFRAALRSARRLERALLAHAAPESSSVRDPGDPRTPLRHLELVDEAYRCTGLLQLYRVFSDLLAERYAPWDRDRLLRPGAPSGGAPSVRERRTWLTKLAMHILGILREIPFESRTRSAQPFIMVAVSSELRRDPQHLQATKSLGELDREGEGLDIMAIDPASIEVARARKFVLSRLAAYAHILPLRKSRVIAELINQTWAALDGGDQDAYWVDIACEKNLGTMMG